MNCRAHRLLFPLCWLSLIAGGLWAAEPKMTTEPLWPADAPELSGDGEGDVPQLIISQVASDQPTAAVVILPGGGYSMHAIDHEGEQIAEWFADLGLTSAICTYRLRGKGNRGAGYGHPVPMQDAQRAIQTIRARALELNVDPDRIGVIGFSAGGHLASTVATHFANVNPDAADPLKRVSSRPDFCILCYPVVVLNADHTHRGSQTNLLGEHPDKGLIESLSNDRQVSPETPPTFLFHTGADVVVPVENSIAFYLACKRNGVAAELHVFPDGRHGVGLAADEPGADQWPTLCKAWMQRTGITVAP